MSGWDERYGRADHVYGTAPNDFLVEVAARLPEGPVLCLAEGEGRNAVWLAERGHDVTAVDGSSVGLAKARALADARGVEIATIHADLAHAVRFGAWSLAGHGPVLPSVSGIWTGIVGDERAFGQPQGRAGAPSLGLRRGGIMQYAEAVAGLHPVEPGWFTTSATASPGSVRADRESLSVRQAVQSIEPRYRENGHKARRLAVRRPGRTPCHGLGSDS